MLRLYDKKLKQIISSDDFILVDNIEYERINVEKGTDIFKGYGYISYDEDADRPIYKDNMVCIVVDTTDNTYSLINEKLNDTPLRLYREVTYRDYLENDSQKRIGKIVRYRDDTFHVFEEQNDKTYDPVTNTMKFDLQKYKKYVYKKIQLSNDEVRDHGFYYELWGAEYLQPFRETPTNDSNTLRYLRDETPETLRALKIFFEDPVTKQRVKDRNRIKWIKGEVEAPREFFDYMIKLMNGYHSYLPDGIEAVLKVLDTKTSESEIRYIEKNYVEMILRGLKDKISSLPYMVQQINLINDYFNSRNIVPRTDAERGV